MQGLKTTHISPGEWRWLLIIAGTLVVLTLVPYAWALAASAETADWYFMGILANPLDGATYLAKINQGMQGAWLLHFAHTPDPHTGAAIQLFYLVLGHLARLIGVSGIVTFHVARIIASLFMLSALYHLGASIWVRQRPRRLFFLLVSLGSGLGWLVVLLNPGISNVPDLVVPEAYPLYAAFTNPHFPLAIGCLALLAAIFVEVFRIDFVAEPSVANGGLTIFLLSLVVALVFPHALVPIGGALALYFLIVAVRRRAIPVRELRWTSMLFLPAGLVAFYYYTVVRYNPIMAAWNAQINNDTAPPLLMLLAYGVLLLLALPGLIRAVRQFEEDGDQLMLIWLVVNFAMVFVPYNHQRRFMVGLIIPVTFFAVRSLEDFWFPRIAQEAHRFAAMLVIALVMPSTVLAMAVPLFGLVNPAAGLSQRLLLEHGYSEAIDWLGANGSADEVVLASPNVSLWIPAFTNKRVVYGHPFETINAQARLFRVEQWFSGEECSWPISAQDRFSISYVLVGPQEMAYARKNEGAAPCFQNIAADSSDVIDLDTVTLYVIRK